MVQETHSVGKATDAADVCCQARTQACLHSWCTVSMSWMLAVVHTSGMELTFAWPFAVQRLFLGSIFLAISACVASLSPLPGSHSHSNLPALPKLYPAGHCMLQSAERMDVLLDMVDSRGFGNSEVQGNLQPVVYGVENFGT